MLFGLLVLAIGAARFATCLPATAQTTFAGSAGNFTMNEYYDPPYEHRMKSLITGVEAHPQPGGRHRIKGLRIELYDENGKQDMIVEAPECVYDSVKRLAHSPGRIKAWTGDGQFYIEGEGFLWRQDASTITISNQVRTIIRDVSRATLQQ